VYGSEFLLRFGHSINSAAVSTAFAMKLKRSGSSTEVPLGSTSVVSEVHYTDSRHDWWKQKFGGGTDFWWRNKKSKNRLEKKRSVNSYGICINFHI
jgi:hypothetical protein